MFIKNSSNILGFLFQKIVELFIKILYNTDQKYTTAQIKGPLLEQKTSCSNNCRSFELKKKSKVEEKSELQNDIQRI